ncbi:hypothetical protein WMF45_13710 [Sorangium sp. So ce448]|uniref:hypothetical protein n=1 Tax=Sorangium sp. So ce448 TaxID=3133314 RepID=UPI003F613087
MRKLTVFNQISLDGYFSDGHGDMSWAHKADAEWRAFTAENARGGGELVFGRVTYELMASCGLEEIRRGGHVVARICLPDRAQRG